MANIGRYSNWLHFTPEIVTSLYKYGTDAPPSDYLARLLPGARAKRPPDDRFEPPTVYFDAIDFMVNGPGRYAKAAKAKFVKDLFDGAFDRRVSELNGKTLAELRRDGIIVGNDIGIAVRQKNWDTDSADYAQRTFIFKFRSFPN